MTTLSGQIASSQLVKYHNKRAKLQKPKLLVEKQCENASNNSYNENAEDKLNQSANSVKEKNSIQNECLKTEDVCWFKELTHEKILEQKVKVENRQILEKLKKKKKKQGSIEGKLVNGDLVYDTGPIDDLLNENNIEDPTLSDGCPVPTRLGKVPRHFVNKNIQELDPFLKERYETFVIIAKRFKTNYINRFSSTNSLFIFSPFNPIRKACLFLSTIQYFDWFMILSIVSNCVLLAIPITDEQSNIAEYIYTAIYSIEAISKIIAKGFILKPYTYLRDPWNWLDFLLLLLSYVTVIISNLSVNNSVNLSSLRVFRVFRAFKTINIIPGLKTIINALFKALVMFLEVLIVMVFFIVIFSLVSLQVYKGTFSQKCVLNYNSTSTTLTYKEWIANESNWLIDTFTGEYLMCANSTNGEGRYCDVGYTCLQGIGRNPNNDLTQFDNFGFAFMQNFQLICLDNWEDIYNRVIDTMGPWNVLYFLPIVFFGSFYLVNLMLAVVSLAYDIESENAKKRLEAPPVRKNTIVYDIKTLKEKIHEKSKLIEERKKKAKKAEQNESKETQIVVSDKTEFEEKSVYTGVLQTIGSYYINQNSNNSCVVSIKLSPNMGNFNSIVQEGLLSSHFVGDELVVDKRNCYPCLKFRKNYMKWQNLQNKCLNIVSNIYFELFITFCIVLNTLIMAIQYDSQPSSVDDLQSYSNYIISSIFMIEALLKMVAYGKLYFKKGSNWFDLFIILMSIIDFSTPSIQGLSVFRSFRLMRIFKLANTWKTMRRILVIIMRSMSSLGYLSLVLFLVIYIFAIIGMELFQDDYKKYYGNENMPRSNFTDILHSLLMILRVLCGECSQPLMECWNASGPICIILYYPTVLFGNFIILNLFLAMLLDAFGADSFKNDEDDEDNKTEKDFTALLNKIKDYLISIKMKLKNSIDRIVPDDIEEHANGDLHKKVEMETLSVEHNKSKNKKLKFRKNKKRENKEVDLENCLPDIFFRKCCRFARRDTTFNKRWESARKRVLAVIEHRVFEGLIILCILVSSIILAFEDVYLKTDSTLYIGLEVADYVFQAIFFIEMLIKLFGYGLKRYFTDWWCLLDFLIVFVSFINLILSFTSNGTQLGFLKVLRTLRALRPLRAISRWEGMKIVVNALGYSIPAIFNVLVVCLIFWLIFSIMGVTLFKGKFYKCIYANTGEKVTDVKNKTECLARNNTMWYNSKINFDNVFNGYLALFQLATFEGWQEIIQDGVDAIDYDIQPQREANPWAYLYFVLFIIFGAFFTLNLFIGVIIDNFNALKKEYEDGFSGLFLTENQKAYLQTMKNIGKKKPRKSIEKPKNKVQNFIFEIVTSTKFEILIIVVIILNMTALSVEYYGQSEAYENTLNVINTVFITLYALEIVFKIIGLRQHFFRDFWNVFDLLVSLFAIFASPFEYYVDNIIVNPVIFRVIRLFRFGKIFRFVKATKGIRKLLYALFISLPALFNVASLLFMIIYIYAILGMNLFLNVKLNGSLTPTMSFQTFLKSLLLLLRVGSISGWNDVMNSLMLTKDDPNSNCDDNYSIQDLPSSVDPQLVNGCGSTTTAVAFMVSYVFIVRLIMINMYIAVILENYDQAHQQEEIGITQDDFEGFYSVWEKYDPHATQFIKLEQLSDLIAEIEPPLGIPKPNEIAITSFDLPIIKGDLIHCLDVLHGVTTYALGRIDETDEFEEVQKQIDRNFLQHFPIRVAHVPISTTVQRKKNEIAAKTLQRAWRQHKIEKNLLQPQQK